MSEIVYEINNQSDDDPHIWACVMCSTDKVKIDEMWAMLVKYGYGYFKLEANDETIATHGKNFLGR